MWYGSLDILQEFTLNDGGGGERQDTNIRTAPSFYGIQTIAGYKFSLGDVDLFLQTHRI